MPFLILTSMAYIKNPVEITSKKFKTTKIFGSQFVRKMSLTNMNSENNMKKNIGKAK